MKILKSQTGWVRKNLAGIGLGTLALSIATSILKALSFEQFLYNVTLVYILIVLLIAVQFGLGPGIATSILGVLALNYFFIPPYHTLYIDSWAGVVALIGFLVAAIITSQVAANARHKAEEARLRQQETSALNQLNMAVLSEAQAEPILDRVVQQVAQNLDALVTLLYLPVESNNGPGLAVRASYAGEQISKDDAAKIFDREQAQLSFEQKKAKYQLDPQGRVAYLPLLRGGETLGVMAVLLKAKAGGAAEDEEIFEPEIRHWLDILANQAALAVDHARLIQETALVASLKEADRLKSALLGLVSHELRTPLTAIKTAVAGLKDEGTDIEPEEQSEYLEVIDQEADRLSRLISNLLELSRLEAGTLKPEKGLYYLPEITAKTLERLERTNILTGHPVRTEFEEELPLVPVDYLQMEQVLTNLIENASKYSLPGRPISIKISQALQPLPAKNKSETEPASPPKQLASGILVEIADQGVGLPEADLERIFDKFYRVDYGSKKGLARVAGSGLGLAICKGIIEAHSGQIWASRLPGGGSLFSFWLPLQIKKELPASKTREDLALT
jgi:two-component system sensor histidine kinase KdpD